MIMCCAHRCSLSPAPGAHPIHIRGQRHRMSACASCQVGGCILLSPPPKKKKESSFDRIGAPTQPQPQPQPQPRIGAPSEQVAPRRPGPVAPP